MMMMMRNISFNRFGGTSRISLCTWVSNTSASTCSCRCARDLHIRHAYSAHAEHGAHAGVLLIMLHMLSQIASGWSCSHLKCFCSCLLVFHWKWLSLAGRALLGLFMNSTSFIMWWSRHLHISSPLHTQGPACLHIRSAARVVGRHSSKPTFQ